MKSRIEEHCRSGFQKFLEYSLGYHDFDWVEVGPQEEPPDYYLRLNAVKFAVEITTLMEQIEINGERFPAATAVASIWGLTHQVEDIARANNLLRGVYKVWFSSPIEEFSRHKDQIQDDLLAYIRATQSEETAPEKLLFKRSHQICVIQKLHAQKNFIGIVGPFIWKWEGEIAKEICALLEERINTKQEKLRNIPVPKILLLYDAYPFADPGMYGACLSNMTNLLFFHTVFLVESDAQGMVLYSEDPDWLSLPKGQHE